MKKVFLPVVVMVIFLVIVIVIVIVPFMAAHAQQPVQINVNLPNVPGTNLPTTPEGIVARFYYFALMIGGLLAFGAIVYGGVMYTLQAGNPSGKSDAKGQITDALLGLLLLVGAYILLGIINPDILQLRLPKLEALNIQVVNPTYPPGSCTPTAGGPASVASLQGSCFGANATKASSIAQGESGGNPNTVSGPDRCRPNGEPVSFGLFQINISANPISLAGGGSLNCPSAFSSAYTGSRPNCGVTNLDLYNQCVSAALDPRNNIQTACRISNGGANWSAWGANRACGF